ncbi:MAG TPA: hypothetical protein VHL61_04525 [Luteimonas sp.]|jgi:hypothetical protein|nr:hypothetical protein [Luteimonas sp.]
MPTPYRLEFHGLGSELRVDIRGDERLPENVLACWLQIAGEVRLRNATRLLAVSHVAGEPMQVDDMRGFFASMSGLGLEGVRVAYVDMAGFKTPLMETAEILASEHGFSARVFDNRIAAELWLRHGSPQEP